MSSNVNLVIIVQRRAVYHRLSFSEQTVQKSLRVRKLVSKIIIWTFWPWTWCRLTEYAKRFISNNYRLSSNQSLSIFDAIIPHGIVISFVKRPDIKLDLGFKPFLVFSFKCFVMDLLDERPSEKISIKKIVPSCCNTFFKYLFCIVIICTYFTSKLC